MTMPVGAVENYDEPEEPQFTIPTMPVHVVSSDAPPGRQVATEHGFWRTYLISPALGAQSATPGAVRIANRSLRRRRLLIAVNGVVSNTNASTQTEQTPANPAVGTPFVYTVPAGVTQSLVSADYQLVTNATVANRFMTITIADATGKVIATSSNNTATPATTTTTLSAYQGAAQISSAGQAQTSLPQNLVLQPGWTVTLSANGFIAGGGGDQIQNITMTFSQPSQSTTDGVVVGNSGVVNSGQPMTPLQGMGAGYIQTGQSLRWECQQELWAAYPASNVGNVIVTVCDEAYASDPKDYEHAEERGENT